jgi:2-polyprenyl-6-methoxyphenol hydroxylase-like FAD-dependent oxidoreductase
MSTAKTVLISGAGIGGPTLAFWLKTAGFEPTIVERAPH